MEGAGDRAWLRSRLDPGERILWSGAPNRRAFILRGPWFMIPFTIAWFAFAVFWTVTAISGGAPVFFWIWGIGFVLIGLYISLGRFVVADVEARRTRYAITDRRVAALVGAFSHEYREISLADMPPAELAEGRDGVGTIHVGTPDPYARWVGAGWPGYRTAGFAFVAIDDAAGVFRLLADARADARQASRA